MKKMIATLCVVGIGLFGDGALGSQGSDYPFPRPHEPVPLPLPVPLPGDEGPRIEAPRNPIIPQQEWPDPPHKVGPDGKRDDDCTLF